MRILLKKRDLCSWIEGSILVLAFTAAFTAVALADLSQTTTLAAPQALNLDTGATASSGGDLLWTGTLLTPQGKAKAAPAGILNDAQYNNLTLLTLQPYASNARTTPFSTLASGAVIVVFTNGGNVAKVQVTAISKTSITFRFTTYGAPGTGPTINKILNNSSEIPAGFPNYGIAPSSLFKIVGTGLADPGDANLHSSEGAGLQTTLNGASISITVGGTTVHPALYYATPTQIDAVLPASTPVGRGTGTLTVTYKGTASTPVAIQTVTSAPGITTYNGSGVAQDAITYALLTYTKSGTPGETIILWGTGLGADAADSDTTYTTSPHTINIPLVVYIGGVQANIVYKGASVYPGVHVIGVVIPASVPTGCFVPVAAVIGNFVSNIVTLPIAAGGGVCSDPLYGIDGNQIATFGGQSTVKIGSVNVSQSTGPGTSGPVTSNNAGAFFSQVTGASYIAGGGTVSIGGCILIQNALGGTTPTVTGLDPGTITVAGPGGTPVPLTATPSFPGSYSATLSSIPSTGGAYVFNGSGGAQVGPFTATVNFPNPLLSWTNQSAAVNVLSSQGLLVRWTGGAPGTYVSIIGNSIGTPDQITSLSGTYSCFAPVAAGQFTVPSYVLLGLPTRGTGATFVQNSANSSPFSATGLDSGTATGSVSFSVNSAYAAAAK